MPTTRLIQVRSYFEPAELARLERARKKLRRVSRSKFIADCAMEKVEALEQLSPAHDGAHRKHNAA